MLAPTPPMGWNSWNTFGVKINEALIRETADAFVETGLKEAGYEYVVLDDGWMAPERGSKGEFVADPEKFPSGMKALGDYIHSKGLKYGIYSCAGTHTCQKLPASYGNEELDARTFASWGVDFLKYDYCYKPPGVDGQALYRKMGQALRTSGRDIIFSLCNWGADEVWKWGASTGGHMWRTTGDISDSWESMAKLGFSQAQLHSYAGPDRWNDPDMLIVGVSGNSQCIGGDGCTDAEYRTHMTLWCLLASPLMIGCDVRDMTPETKATLTAPEVLAVDQDPLGRQARSLSAENHNVQVWTKPLADGSVAVGLFNKATKGERLATVAWESLGIGIDTEATVRDLWAGADLGVFRGSFASSIEPHGCRLVKVTPPAPGE